MNCEEVRNAILNGSNNEEISNHVSNCDNCKIWIEKELSTPPDGMSEENWDSIKNKIFEKNENPEIKSKETPNEKSFLDYYLSGLKYGVVFGLAIVVGFSLVQNKNDNQKINSESTNYIASDSMVIQKEIASNTINISNE